MAGEAGNEGLTFHPMDQFKVKPLFGEALDYFAVSNHIERDDLELAPFDGMGGLGKMYQLFGAEMDKVLD